MARVAAKGRHVRQSGRPSTHPSLDDALGKRELFKRDFRPCLSHWQPFSEMTEKDDDGRDPFQKFSSVEGHGRTVSTAASDA
jgi:hypothetical protein